MKAKRGLKGSLGQNAITIAALAALVIVFAVLNPNFLSKYNIVSMTQSLAPYAKTITDFIATLRVGDTVRLTQEHRYGQIGDCVMPFRPIISAEKVVKKPAVPAIPAAPAGDYSTMPL